MVPTTEAIQPEKQRRGVAAAVKEGGRIIATTFLSLLLPLCFLLLARLSVARYFLSSDINDHETSSFLRSVFLQCKTTLILSFIVDIVAIEALLQGFIGNKPAFVICERRRICVAWVLIFLVQVCLILGIHGTIDAEINIFEVGNLVSPRRIVFVLGLHEITLFWRRSVVAPVVEETMFGSTDKGFSWVEEVVLAAAFGNLWWRRLRDEADALVVVPLVTAELKMSVEMKVANAVGWLLYYLTATIGGVRVIKGLLWVAMRISGHRHWPKKKGVARDAAVNSPV